MAVRVVFLAAAAVLAACGSPKPPPDGGTDGGVDAGVQCSGLDKDACWARTGCVVDTCDNCSCTPQFKQCRRPDEAAFECPVPPCPLFQCCDDTSSPCPGTCMTPGTELCGTCPPTSCAGDSDCTGGFVCQPSPCGCANGCVPNCVLGGCREGEVCGVNGHCQPAPCDGGVDCPHLFFCQAGGCERSYCSPSVPCGDGAHCVASRCYEGRGTCR